MKNKRKWFRLDNAAKIFPPTSTKRDPKVFRFVCELTEEIDKEYLQQALKNTLELFPGFQTSLKQGIFWYFLETTLEKPIVKKEELPPCASLYNNNPKDLLFRVTYYKTRINLEVYHALTDGTGAMEFLKVLVHFYLTLKHFKGKETPTLDYDATLTERMSDSFMKYYDSKKVKMIMPDKMAYQLKGEKIGHNRLLVTEGYLNTKEVLKVAHEYGATITTLLTSAYMLAIAENMSIKDKKKPVVVTIPVNLRKYFASATARNFFSVVNIPYLFKNENTDLKMVINGIKDNLKKELETEHIEIQMNRLAALEHNFLVKFIPLFVKNIILRVSSIISDLSTTCCVSNVGRVSMPEEFSPYIKRFSVFVSTSRQQICVCSYKDELTIGLTSSFVSTDIACKFFRILTSLGLEVTIATNQVDE